MFQVSPLLLLTQEELAYQRIVQELMAYERAYYQNRVYQRKKNSKPNIQSLMYEDELVDVLDDCEHQSGDQFEKGSLLPTEQQAFHSMAEIVSCSYEARKASQFVVYQ